MLTTGDGDVRCHGLGLRCGVGDDDDARAPAPGDLQGLGHHRGRFGDFDADDVAGAAGIVARG